MIKFWKVRSKVNVGGGGMRPTERPFSLSVLLSYFLFRTLLRRLSVNILKHLTEKLLCRFCS